MRKITKNRNGKQEIGKVGGTRNGKQEIKKQKETGKI